MTSPCSCRPSMSSSSATRPGASSSPPISWSNGASSASARSTLASRQLAERGVGLRVDLPDGVRQRRAVDVRALVQVDHANAGGVAGDVDRGVVGEAGVLVLLVLGVVGDGDALTGQLALRQGAHAPEDVGDRLVGIGEELVAVGAVLGIPLVAHAGEVVDEQLGEQREVGAPPVGVGGRGVVGDRTGARAVVAEVLSPQQELDGVPPRGDVGLATLFVGRHEHVGGDLGHARHVVHDPGFGVAVDVVDVRLIEGPGVDLAFGPVLGVVDRAIVEAEGFGGSVQEPAVEPGLLGGLEGLVGRTGHEGVDARLQRLDRGRHVGVRAVDDIAYDVATASGASSGRAVVPPPDVVVVSAVSSGSSSSEHAAAPRRAPARTTATSRRGNRCVT